MKLLPTPQSYIHGEQTLALQGFSCVQCQVNQDETIFWGLSQLEGKLTIPFAEGGVLTLTQKEDPFFQEKNATEQGYILLRNGKDVTIYAKTSVGFLYGLMTLRQLAGNAPATIEIKDRPNVRFRGNMNTLWAESGVWSYDFGDGLDAACRRIRKAIDEAAYAKLNMMYVDAFGFKSGDDRFKGYNEALRSLSDYGRVRGVYFMVGGYGMGYGQSAFANNAFQGRVFRNRYPYPDGELYDCIGNFNPREMTSVDQITGRSYGTCLSNKALTDDKISELREYFQNTGCRMVYLHNIDADQLYEPLWLARCKHCKEKYPNDDLFARDGAAGAFADFYDQILGELKKDFPDVVICAVSPGYCYIQQSNDENFLLCRKFWASVLSYMEHSDALVPTFRELLLQHDSSGVRFDLLDEMVPSYGCVFFSSGDGFYSDKIFTPSAAYVKLMHHSDVMIFANGGALQKATQYANAEYAWNPDNSAYWDPEFPNTFEEQFAHYEALREGQIRPEGIYGEGGLLETACQHLFGEKYGKQVADVFRIRGKNGECPIFTACNVEIFTNYTRRNLPMLWDTPVDAEQQKKFRERFAESTLVTYTAQEMLSQILEEDLDADARKHLSYLYDASKLCLKLCSLLTRYMDLYMEADAVLTADGQLHGDLVARCQALVQDADDVFHKIRSEKYQPFDVLGGVSVRRDEVADLVRYSTSQILQSLRTGQRIPDEKRALDVHSWW